MQQTASTKRLSQPKRSPRRPRRSAASKASKASEDSEAGSEADDVVVVRVPRHAVHANSPYRAALTQQYGLLVVRRRACRGG